MRVLIDYHHADLWESWNLLLGDRFGWDIYAPIGMEWFDQGFWNFERIVLGDVVARQYLEGIWPNRRLISASQVPEGVEHYAQADPTHPGRLIRGVTLETALATKWDIVIATLPDNEDGLHRVARMTGAKYGVQIGNQWQMTDWSDADFGLVSATLQVEPTRPYVTYRQPFSLRDFRYEPPPRGETFRIASAVQGLAENPRAYAEYLEYAREDPSFAWGIYGSYGQAEPDEFSWGNLPSTPAVAAAMRSVDVAWHTKEWSDGYGHVIHNWFASGRPVVGREFYYTDKLAGALWRDGVTSIDIGSRTVDEVRAVLRRFREDEEYHLGFCERAAARFAEVVNFDEEAEIIRAMFARVL
jgi:hypothetical protein